MVSLSKRLLSEFALLKSTAISNSHDQRLVCSRDFFKFISRALKTGNDSETPLHHYLDALDCFICSQTTRLTFDELAIQLGGIFNFTRDQSVKIWQARRPDLILDLTSTKVKAGRALLPVRRSIYWELYLSK